MRGAQEEGWLDLLRPSRSLGERVSRPVSLKGEELLSGLIEMVNQRELT